MIALVSLQFFVPDLNELTVDQLPEVFFRRRFEKNDWSLKASGESGTGSQHRRWEFDLQVTLEVDHPETARQAVLSHVEQIPTAVVTNVQAVEVPAPAPELALGGEEVISTKVTLQFRAYCTQASLAALFDAISPLRPPLRIVENRGGDVLAETDFVMTAPAESFDQLEAEKAAREKLAAICAAGGYSFAVESVTSGPA